MAIAFSQATTGSLSVATSGTAIWGGNTTTGNTAIVGIMTNQPSGLVSVSSVTDSQGNFYTVAKTFVNTAAGQVIEVWYASNIIGGTTPTVTINSRRAITGGIIAREYSGLSIGNSFDTGISGTGSSASPSSGSTPIATRNANEVAVGFMVYGSVTPTISLGAGYANLTTLTGGGSQHLGAEDNIVSSTGFQTATFGSTATAQWLCAVATFADTTEIQPTSFNNFQFVGVHDNGNGVMSVTEKIR